MNIKSTLSIILLTSILPACSSLQNSQTHNIDGIPSDNKAVLELLTSAREYRQQGEYERSIATLERALRLEPANAQLWLELAKSNHEQGKNAQALSLAKRAQSLAVDAATKHEVSQLLDALQPALTNQH